MAGLQDVFTPSRARLAPLEGGLPDMGGGGNAPADSPDASNAPSLTLTGNPGVMGAMAQGANAASLTGMAGLGLGLSQNGLFSGNISPEGALSTVGNVGLNVLGGAIPGFGMSNAISKGMGALSGLATLFGLRGQQTDGHLNGPITEGLVAQVARNQSPFNNPLNIPTPRITGPDPDDPTPDDPDPSLTVDDDGNPAVSNDPDGGGTGAGPGSASGPGGSAGSPSGGGDSGNPGDFHKGGTVRAKKKGGDVRITAQDDEEVIRRSEARRPGVRAALKEINEPGEGHVERGLSALFRKRG